MDNQHRAIAGYRELGADDIALMNQIKALGEPIEAVIAALRTRGDLDQRWVSIGITDLQTGLMALTRAVAQPTTF